MDDDRIARSIVTAGWLVASAIAISSVKGSDIKGLIEWLGEWQKNHGLQIENTQEN